MELGSEKTCDQSQSSNHEKLQDLKKNVTYTNAQLHKLISNQQNFIERIKELNRKAVQEINYELYEEANVYLGEAEKNLEYAASCGLAIDRILIITTLKNLACGYQRLWELNTCYDYMEALIFNLSIQSEDHSQLLKKQLIKDHGSLEYEKLSKIVNIKLKLALSYLQFSALSSQLGKHEEAKNIVGKSLEQFKILTEICHSYELLAKGKNSLLLDNIRSSLQLDKRKPIIEMLIETKEGLQKIQQHAYFFSFDSALIEKLSMGDIMQVGCYTVEQTSQLEGITWFISQLGLTYLAIYISCCFFALATQIRLNIPQQYRAQPQYKQQMESAKLHHLHAIKIASQFVLIESNYLNHIVKSFKNNFHIDILNQQLVIPKLSEISSYKASEIEQHPPNAKIQYEESEKDQNKKDEIGIQVSFIQPFANTKSKAELKKFQVQEKEQNSRKNSVTSGLKSSHKRLKKKESEQIVLKTSRNKLKQVITSRSHESKSIKNRKKSELKNMTKNIRTHDQYFVSPKHSRQTKGNIQSKKSGIVFPRSPQNKMQKIVRKSEKSTSRPKLKIKSFKSPPRP